MRKLNDEEIVKCARYISTADLAITVNFFHAVLTHCMPMRQYVGYANLYCWLPRVALVALMLGVGTWDDVEENAKSIMDYSSELLATKKFSDTPPVNLEDLKTFNRSEPDIRKAIGDLGRCIMKQSVDMMVDAFTH